MNKLLTGLIFPLLLVGLTSLAADESAQGSSDRTSGEPAAQEQEWQQLARGIRFQDLHVGDGKEPGLWDTVHVFYKLTAENGTVLTDTFKTHGRAARHTIGAGTMPEVVEMAIGSMQERGRRLLMIPAELLQLSDFHVHDEDEDEEAHDEELTRLTTALRPGGQVKAEISLLWVRPYDPANFNRFR